MGASGARRTNYVIHRILLITSDTTDAKILEDVLGNAGEDTFTVLWVINLADGIKRLQEGDIDAVMADLSLPDSHGMETFDKLSAVAPHTPIMMLFSVGDEMLTSE